MGWIQREEDEVGEGLLILQLKVRLGMNMMGWLCNMRSFSSILILILIRSQTSKPKAKVGRLKGGKTDVRFTTFRIGESRYLPSLCTPNGWLEPHRGECEHDTCA